MDIETLGAAIAYAKGAPNTAVSKAEAAKAAAEQAAELAQTYGYRLSVEGTTLVIGEEDET